MTYIYDLLLNFHENFYDVYEWNTEDQFSYIKKIPVFKINNKYFYEMKNHRVMIDQNMLDIIQNKTEIILNGESKYIDYACLFSTTKEAMGVVFDKEGNVVLKSSLLIDEEQDTLYQIKKIPTLKLDYKMIEEQKNNPFQTRNEKRIVGMIHDELNKLYHEKRYEKLRYLYYECFNKMIGNIDMMHQELVQFLHTNFSTQHMRIYNIIKLSISR